jgi:hypothetical protein
MMDLCLKDQDLVIINGDFALCADDCAALAQSISMRLKTLSGEWFLDTSAGIPYLSEIFGQKRSHLFIRQAILPHVEAVPGVKEVTDFQVEEQPDRVMLITFTVVLNDGSSLKFKEPVGV